MRCKPRFSSSSLFFVSSNAKQKNRILWSKGWNGGRQRDEGHPSSDTNLLGVDKTASAEEITQSESVERKNLRMGDMKQNTQRERERERHKEVYLY